MKKIILIISVIFSCVFCLKVDAEISVERSFPYTNGSIDFYFNDIEINDEHTYSWAIEKLASTEPTTYFEVLNPDYENRQIKLSVLSTDTTHLSILKSTNTAYITIKDNEDNVILDSYKVDLTLEPLFGFSVNKSGKNNSAFDVSARYGIKSENIQFLFEKIEDKNVINKFVDNNKDLSTLNLKSLTEKPLDSDTRWSSIYASFGTILSRDVPTEDGLYYLWLKGNGSDIKTIYGYDIIEVGTVTKVEDEPVIDDNENDIETPATPDEPNKEDEFVEELLGDDINTELVVVKPSSETKYLDDNQGYISKDIVSSDSKNGEVIIELKLHNALKKEHITNQTSGNYEIFLVIDDSGSMSTTISTGETREEAVYNAAKQLVSNLLKKYTNVKIGIIKFSSGGFDNNPPAAEIMCNLTNDETTIMNAIEAEASGFGATNIEAGLILANDNFSKNDVNKILVVLTDGAPNDQETNTDANGNSLSVDEATKNKLIELEKSGIHIISMLTEIANTESAEFIFGTSENPTVGKYYYIADADIQKVITENIFADISDIVANLPIYNITLTDYFPNDILKYFEFSYISKPSNGTISEDITNNSIVYSLSELKGNEEIIIKYRLKLKNMKYKVLLDKVISTNEKVVLDYTDSDGKSHNVVLDSSPTIKLQEAKEVDKPLENPPQTGIETYVFLIVMGLLISTSIGIFIKKKNYFKKI